MGVYMSNTKNMEKSKNDKRPTYRYELDQIDLAIVLIGIVGIIAMVGMIFTDKNFSDLLTNIIIAIGSLATGRGIKP